MATGAQAAALMVSQKGTPTPDNDCVHGLVTRVFNPLGVPVPQVAVVSKFLDGKLMQQVPGPFVGAVGRFPQSQGYEHVCLITGVSGGTVTEYSFGTSTGFVRGANYDAGWMESYWTPAYDGQVSPIIETASDTGSGAANPNTSTGTPLDWIPGLGYLTQPALWKRVGVFSIGAVVLLIAVIYILSQTQVGQSAIKAVKSTAVKAAETAAVV